jgi:uncharacterized membrane protein
MGMAYSDTCVLLELLGTMVCGLAVSVLVYRCRSGLQHRMKRWRHGTLTQKQARCLVGLLIVSYITIFSTLSLLRHGNLYSHNNLAIHAQVMWNTTQGRWFDTTLLEDRHTNYLGHHFSPALLLLMPLYLVWPDAALLLLVQTILLALGVVPVYAYARRATGSELIAISLSAAYLLFPALQYTNLFEFHEITLAVPLLSFTAYWLLTKRYRLFFVFLILSLLVKEEIAFVTVAFASYIVLVQRRYRLGILVLLLAVGWGFLTMGIIMPAIAGDIYFPTGRYDYLGASFVEVARSVLLDPLLPLRHLLALAKLEYLLQFLVPLGLLPLLGFDTLILTVPTALYTLLSDYAPQYSIHYHYTAPLIPLAFMAGVDGARRLVRWKGGSVTVAVSVLILVTEVLSYLLQGPGPLAAHFNRQGQYNVWPHLASAYDALAAIPSDASVMTMEEFAPHLAAREEIYVENESCLPVEYILQEHTARAATPRYPALVPEGRDLVYPLYETVFDRDGYWVRRYEDSVPISNELGASFENQVTLLGYQWRDQDGLLTPVLKPGGYLDLIVAWRAEGQLTERYAFFVHLLDQGSHRWAQVDKEVERGVYRTTTWEPGMVVADHYKLSIPWGTPPGEYQVLIGVYSRATAERLRPVDGESEVRDNALALGSVQVVKPDSPAPSEALSPQHRLDVRLNDELELVGHDLGITAVEPGGTIPLILTWRALASMTDEYTVAPLLDQVDGERRLRCSEEPIGISYRPDKWQVSEVVRDWHDVHVPREAPAGRYEILIEVLKAREIIGEISIGHLDVQGRPRDFAAPGPEFPMEAKVGDGVLFLGYDLVVDQVTPDEPLEFALYWQALDEMDVSYTVFTHLLDVDERVWGQADSIPLCGEAPTTSWLPGEIITDRYEIVVDPEAPPGAFVIEIGMYDATTGERLPIFVDDQRLEGDRLLLEEIRIVP